jgi:hypothetical protein
MTNNPQTALMAGMSLRPAAENRNPHPREPVAHGPDRGRGGAQDF